MYAGDSLDEPDYYYVSLCCTWRVCRGGGNMLTGCCMGRTSVYFGGSICKTDWDKGRLFNDKLLHQDQEGEVRQNGISGPDHNERKRSSSGRERDPGGKLPSCLTDAGAGTCVTRCFHR